MKCPLCHNSANLKYEGLNGYIEGGKFDVYECTTCNATFVDPLVSDKKLYNYIYNLGDKAPGYERYLRYAQLVLDSENPLKLLADAENVYFGVKEAVEKNFPNKNISILEIGTGLGYLTYSLNKAGYKTVGLDISEEAVSRANKRYGNYYTSGDLFKVSKEIKYDCVIMTELIEHVENPKDFIGAALSLVKEGGKLILTTPNKSIAPKDTIWQSDVPPVHLWWLAEESVACIAKSFNKNCEFIDFTPYTSKFYEDKAVVPIEKIQASLPRMDKNGKLLSHYENNSFKSRYLSPKIRYVLSYIRRRIIKKITSNRSATMCAIIY